MLVQTIQNWIAFQINMPRKQKIFEGQKFPLNNGGFAIVTKYNRWNDIKVITNNGYESSINSSNLLKGTLKDKLHKMYYDVGYTGIGKYNIFSKSGICWINMLKRCYDKSFHLRQPTYTNCTVSKNWHNFQNFAKWYNDNYVENYHLDKDLLVYGNKLYSQDTCIFVPRELNSLFQTNSRNNESLPFGVKKHGIGYHSILNYNLVYSINEAKNNYWNEKHSKLKYLIYEFPKFEKVLNEYFESFFGEHYD